MTDPFQQDPNGTPINDKRRRAVESVRRFMARSDQYRKPYLELAKEARELYEVWKATGRTPINRANLALPYAYQIVQEEIGSLAQPFFAERTPYVLRGELEDGMIFEHALTDHAGYQLERAGWATKFFGFLDRLCIEGTAFQKVPYKYVEQEVIRRKAIQTPAGIPVVERFSEIVVKHDGPDLEDIAFEDFFPDWTIRTAGAVQQMRGAVHRFYRTTAELRDKEKRKLEDGSVVGIYEHLDELSESIKTKGADAWAKPYYSGDYSASKDEDAKKPVECWEYWGLFDVSGNGDYEEYIITVANGDVAIRCERNFYDFKLKPFIATPNVVRGCEFYGISELFAVRGSITEAIRLRNARLDAVNMAVHPMWVLERAAGVNPNAVYMRSNGVVLTNDIKGLQRLPPPEVPASSFSELQELGSEIQQASGTLSGPSLTQAGRVFGRSASGANLVNNIVNARVNTKLLLLSHLYFKPMAEMFMQMNAQFIDKNQTVRTSNPDALQAYVTIPADAFQLGYAYEPLSSIQLNKEAEAASLQMGFQALQAADMAMPGTVNWQVFFDEMGRAIFGRRMKKFIRPPEEVAQLNAMKVAGEQMANQLVGQNAPQPGV
jgi:hypothetical protein